MPSEIRSSYDPLPAPGPFLARVVSHLDPNFMGGLEVEILSLVGGDGSQGTLHQVKYMTPFAGQTSVDYVGADSDEDDASVRYNNTQKSYGMWMIPPDVGAIVMVIFIDGDPRKGYWFGCVPDEHQNFMTPGLAATKFNKESESLRVPVAEYNKKSNEAAQPDATKIKKPEHPFTNVLLDQGLLEDDIRGITTSSARREVPSMVFGISTPGPLDKQSNAKTGKIGKQEYQISGAFVSRLGGTTFVMDDGDDKFLRRTPANEGPPDYASTSDGETDGDPTIPHNELVRIRTRTGHQILLHNSEDLIYIGNAKGTTWVELTSNGKIDIYAKDSISVHTENDINFTADRDINLTAGRNVNINTVTNFNVYAGVNYEIKAEEDGKLTVGGQSNIKAGGNHVETASQIHMNGPEASEAETAPKSQRIPLVEPWAGHENLDPLSHTPDLTEALLEPELIEPEYFKKYTTVTDPFEKIKPPETEPEQ